MDKELWTLLSRGDRALGRLDGLPVSLQLSREIHAKLMEGVRGGEKTPGEFRQAVDAVTEGRMAEVAEDVIAAGFVLHHRGHGLSAG